MTMRCIGARRATSVRSRTSRSRSPAFRSSMPCRARLLHAAEALPAVLMEKAAPSADGVGMALARSSTVMLLACLLAACASDPIEVSGDAATLPPFKSFRIDAEQFAFATEISPEQRDQVSRALREAAVSALEKRGYRQATDADVL